MVLVKNMGSQFRNMQPVIDLFRIELEIQRAKLQKQYSVALALYDQVISIKQQVPNKLGLAKTVAEKAFLLEQLGHLPEAYHTYQCAQQIANGTPNQEFIASINQRIAKFNPSLF